MRRRLSVWAYLGGWSVVRRLPSSVAYRLFTLVADLAWRRRTAGVRRLETNLARVRPELDADGLRALSRQGMRSYLRYWCDSFRLPSWSPEQIRACVRVEGDGPVRASLEAGQGVVAALSHQGNWDLAGAWSALDLSRVTTVAERLEPVEVFDAFLAYRTQIGIDVLALGDDGVFLGLVRALRAGRLVPLLCDRDLSRNGIEVDLCGNPARMAAGPATLAEMTGAPLHPLSIWYEALDSRSLEAAAGSGSGYRIVLRFHPAVPVPDLPTKRERIRARTQACAQALGEGIHEHPQDWHMLQPVFSADLDPARIARALRSAQPGAGVTQE